MDGDHRSDTTSVVYWMLAFLSLAFGMLAIFSIGFPFVVLGLMLVILGPFRQKPLVFWPALAGTLIAIATLFVVMPWGCRTSVSELSIMPPSGSDTVETRPAPTVCPGLLLPDIVGEGPPAWWPFFAVSLTAGALGFAATRLIMRRRSS